MQPLRKHHPRGFTLTEGLLASAAGGIAPYDKKGSPKSSLVIEGGLITSLYGTDQNLLGSHLLTYVETRCVLHDFSGAVDPWGPDATMEIVRYE